MTYAEEKIKLRKNERERERERKLPRVQQQQQICLLFPVDNSAPRRFKLLIDRYTRQNARTIGIRARSNYGGTPRYGNALLASNSIKLHGTSCTT